MWPKGSAELWREKDTEVRDRLAAEGFRGIEEHVHQEDFGMVWAPGRKGCCQLRASVYTASKAKRKAVVVCVAMEHKASGTGWQPPRCVYDVTFEAEDESELKVLRHIHAIWQDPWEIAGGIPDDWDYFCALRRDIGDVLEAVLKKHPEFADDLLVMHKNLSHRRSAWVSRVSERVGTRVGNDPMENDEIDSRVALYAACEGVLQWRLQQRLQQRREEARDALMAAAKLCFDAAELVASYL